MENIDSDEKELEFFYQNIGKNIARIRKEKGISQLDLSQAIGHKSTTIVSMAEISKGKHFNLKHIFKIAKYLEVDICEFMKIKSNL